MNPNLKVIGDTYPVPPMKQMGAKVMGFVQMALMAVIIVGNGLTDVVGISDWTVVQKMQENKIMSCFVTFILCNNVIGSLASSGAFEIYVDGELKFSKLANGKMPDANDINGILGQYGVNFNNRP